MITTKDHYVSVSETAGRMLKERFPDEDLDDHRDLKKFVLRAINGQCDVMPKSKELHYLVKTSLNGKEVVFICVTNSGSPAGIQPWTTIIKGIMAPSDAEAMLQRGRGLVELKNFFSRDKTLA